MNRRSCVPVIQNPLANRFSILLLFELVLKAEEKEVIHITLDANRQANKKVQVTQMLSEFNFALGLEETGTEAKQSLGKRRKETTITEFGIEW